jgi:hypothetical protein
MGRKSSHYSHPEGFLLPPALRVEYSFCAMETALIYSHSHVFKYLIGFMGMRFKLKSYLAWKLLNTKDTKYTKIPFVHFVYFVVNFCSVGFIS